MTVLVVVRGCMYDGDVNKGIDQNNREVMIDWSASHGVVAVRVIRSHFSVDDRLRWF